MNTTDQPDRTDNSRDVQAGEGTDHRPPPPATRPLRHCDVGDVVTTPAGRVLVVLNPCPSQPGPGEPAPATEMEVHGENGITTRAGDEFVVPVGQTKHQVDPLKNAIAALAHSRRTDTETIAALRAGHAEELAEIRRYAIERHRDGDICREGLNEFLTNFGLGVYQPRVRVTFTNTGTYEVDDEDGDGAYAASDARECLRMDLSDITRVIDGSDDLTVQVDGVTALDN